MLIRLAFSALLLGFVLLLPASAEQRRLIVLHTNDLHGHLEAESDRGFVRIASLIRAIKQAFPGQVVLLDGGDTSLGTPLSGLNFGVPMAKSMQSLGYDAVTLGNHEFNWGKEKMAHFTGLMGAQILSANLVKTEDSGHPYRPWTVLERNGCKLGVFGLVTPDTYRKAPAAATEGWTFLPPADGARIALQAMPEVDAVIALTHLGVPEDRALVEEVSGIDLVVGGHTHTALQELVVNKGVPIVQSGCYAQYLGFLELLVDTETNSLEVLQYRLIPVNESTALDPTVNDIVQEYAEKIGPILNRVAGRVQEVVKKSPTEGCYDTPLGNLTCDVMRETTGAEVAFYNRFGVRTDMAAGELTVGGIHKLFPFNDPIVLITVSGQDLARIVLQGTIGGEGPLSASGLTATVHSDGTLSNVLIHGEPLQEERQYTVATTKFLSTGGDGMTEFSRHEVQVVSDYPRVLLERYLETHPTLTAPKADRLKSEPKLSKSTPAKSLVVAHRGGVGLGPENTLATFGEALALGVDAIELDIHQSRDGHLMVIHDLTLERTYDATGRVDRMTLAELRKVGVPTLQDVINLVDGRCRLFVEVKQPKDGTYHKGIEARLLKVLEENELTDTTVVISFYENTLRRLHELSPQLTTGYLYRHPGYTLSAAKKELGVKYVGPHYLQATDSFIQEAHKLGLKVGPWTVNEPEDMQRLIKANCDAITTNHPDKLLEERRRR